MIDTATRRTCERLPRNGVPLRALCDRHARNGATIVELMIALAVLAAVLVTVTQALLGLAIQRRAAQRQQQALIEAANVMERMMALPFDDVTDEKAAGAELSEESQRVLPDGSLRVRVSDAEQPPAGKRIEVEVGWRNRAGQMHQSARLVAWKYRTEGQQP